MWVVPLATAPWPSTTRAWAGLGRAGVPLHNRSRLTSYRIELGWFVLQEDLKPSTKPEAERNPTWFLNGKSFERQEGTLSLLSVVVVVILIHQHHIYLSRLLAFD